MTPTHAVDLQGVLAHMDEVVYQVDFVPSDPHGGRVRFVGGRVEALLGYRPEEFLSDPGMWARLVHPEDWPGLVASTREVVRSNAPGTRRYRLRARLDEDWHWMEDRVVPQADEHGNVVSLFGAARDVTRCRRWEDERDQFAGALEQIADSVLVTDVEGRIEFVNPAFEALTGFPADEVVGRNPNVLKSGRHTPEFYRDLWETLLAGKVYRAEFLNRRKNGDLYLEEKTIAPVVDAHGRMTHFVSVGRDITLRRQEEQRARASQRLEAMGQLAGGVAHDFNNLLTVITGYADLLGRRLENDEELRECARHILMTSERAGLIARQLLTFSRQEATAPCTLEAAGAVRRLQPVIERLAGPQATLRLEIAETRAGVHIDPSAFDQVLLNLVVNARNAIAGSGRIEVTLREVPAGLAPGHLGLDPAVEHWVCLDVTDDGVGMDDETVQRIFEPFFTTRPGAGGTGLGLAIVKSVVSASRGVIDVSSTPGSGTRFTVLLPRVEADAGDAAPPKEAPPASGGGKAILLVEDDPEVRRLMALTLRLHEYQVFEAADAAQALAFAESPDFGRVALVVTDLMLPGTPGDRLLSALRERRSDLRALVVSGFAGTLMAEARTLPADVGLLSKPFSPDELVRRVQELLPARSPGESGGCAPDSGEHLPGERR